VKKVHVWKFALGIILIPLGLLVMALSMVTVYSDAKVVEYAGGENQPWGKPKSSQISAKYTKGDYLIVYFIPNAMWTEVGFDSNDYFENFQTVYVDIICPDGNITSFAVMLQYDEPSKFYGVRVKAAIKTCNSIVVINSSSIQDPPDKIKKYFSGEDSIPCEEIGGIVQRDGNYTAIISGPYTDKGGATDPPSYLGLLKRRLERPYFYLLPVGGGVTVAGSALIIYSLKIRKKVIRKPKVLRR